MNIKCDLARDKYIELSLSVLERKRKKGKKNALLPEYKMKGE